jgi:hypothetical protein
MQMRSFKASRRSSYPIGNMEQPFYLYSNAFVFEACEDVDIAFCNALVLFNLGLAFHQRAINFGEEPKLRKAFSFYDLSMQLINELSAYSGALLLAALNNSAQIQVELGEYQRACETLEVLQSEAIHVPAGLLEQEDMDQFFLNAALTRPPTAAACA